MEHQVSVVEGKTNSGTQIHQFLDLESAIPGQKAISCAQPRNPCMDRYSSIIADDSHEQSLGDCESSIKLIGLKRLNRRGQHLRCSRPYCRPLLSLITGLFLLLLSMESVEGFVSLVPTVRSKWLVPRSASFASVSMVLNAIQRG